MSIFHPVDWVRIWELERLMKAQAKLTARGLPTPPWMSSKITELQEDLSTS